MHFEVDRVMQARSQFGNASGIARIIEANATSRLEPGAKVYFRIKLPETSSFTLQNGIEIKATGVVSLSMALFGLHSIAGFINHAAWISIQMMDTLVLGSTKIPVMILDCEGFAEWIAYSALVVYFTLLFCINRERSQRSSVMWLLAPAIIIAGLLIGLAKI